MTPPPPPPAALQPRLPYGHAGGGGRLHGAPSPSAARFLRLLLAVTLLAVALGLAIARWAAAPRQAPDLPAWAEAAQAKLDAAQRRVRELELDLVLARRREPAAAAVVERGGEPGLDAGASSSSSSSASSASRRRAEEAESALAQAREELRRCRDAAAGAASGAPAELGKRLEVVEKRMARMKRVAQQEALARLRAQWGKGPLDIRLETSEGDLLVRTAPFDAMPVAVEFFVNLVQDKYYDDTSFFRAEQHVVQATARSALTGKYKPARSGLSFQEFTPNFHHARWTLGLAGRPASTDFYVNMIDNRRSHGPGGQGTDFPGDAESDPCFATLVEGADIMQRIQRAPYTKSGGLHILDKPVQIRRAYVVSAGAAEASVA